MKLEPEIDNFQKQAGDGAPKIDFLEWDSEAKIQIWFSRGNV